MSEREGEILDFLRARFAWLDERFDRLETRLDDSPNASAALNAKLWICTSTTRSFTSGSTISTSASAASSVGLNWPRHERAARC